MITDYHSQLYANELTLRAPMGTIERIATALMDSRIDLNPHQVDAAVFAFRSHFSKGALLADEVGLGKTIEAGILIAQRWAEKRRRILVIVPANLRKQWEIELEDKFGLPSVILESKSFNDALRSGNLNPFETDKIVITSYAFARNKEGYIAKTAWDLAVIDEAHRLRNVYKSGNKIGSSIKNALASAPKILLTATPLQNNLMELYGLVGLIDDHIFGDEKSFRELFMAEESQSSYIELRNRLKNVCKRTLRKQVLKYIRYTKRHAYTQKFESTEAEDQLYNEVSEYLRRETLQALPNSRRKLMTMILRKLLASSSYAIAGTLASLIARLEGMLRSDSSICANIDIEEDFETAGEYQNFDEPSDSAADAVPEMGGDFSVETDPDLAKGSKSDGKIGSDDKSLIDDRCDSYESHSSQSHACISESERKAIEAEIADLKRYLSHALAIGENSKGKALLIALREGFRLAGSFGGAEKAVIFTESRRTQKYLRDLLSSNGYAGRIMLFNGTNSDEESKSVYRRWCAKNPDRIGNSKSADMRTALVEHFRDEAQIMIATEAAAEGINLQFCSLVVNYDLPWNPQRIEQRIGRCHRYGQKYDVVVVNFLNVNNEADCRVFEILEKKLKLFEGVFGASDEILGAIGNGVDFERRIALIYQNCRTSADIQREFDFMRDEFAVEIGENMRTARRKLLENFDAEVAERLNIFQEASSATIGRMQALLWALTKHELAGSGTFFDEENLTFQMTNPCLANAYGKSLYSLKRGNYSSVLYGVTTPLARELIDRAIGRELPRALLIFDYGGSVGKITAIENLPAKSGRLMLSKLSIGSGADIEEHLVLSCVDAFGREIDQEVARRFFNLNAAVCQIDGSSFDFSALDAVFERRKAEIVKAGKLKSEKEFDAEIEKLERWSQDRKNALEIKLKDMDKRVRELKKTFRQPHTLEEKIELQRRQKALDNERMNMRRKLFEAQDAIDAERDKLIENAEKSLQKPVNSQIIFAIDWRIV